MDNFSDIITNYFKNDYRERGIVKWQGFFLSDHTSQLNIINKERRNVTEALDPQSLDLSLNQLMNAYSNYVPVLVQKNDINFDHQFTKNIIGYIDGFGDDFVSVNKEKIYFENIRAVQYKKDYNN